MDNFGTGPAGLLRKDFSCREPSQKEFPCEGLSWSRRDREGQNGKNRQGQRGLPFYMTYPDLLFREEDAAARDLEYLIQMYPKQAGKYREKISRMLDHVDYRGSMIYDEYPDRLALFRLADSIHERIRQEEAPDRVKTEEEPGGAASEENGEKDLDRKTLIQILLYYEIFRRRRKSGKMPVVYPDKNDYNGYGG